MNEYLSVSSLRSWRNCFCACEIFGDEALFSWVCLEKRAPKRLLHIRRTALKAPLPKLSLREQFRALLKLKCLLLFLCISGGDGGWKECAWSETLGQCFSPSYLPIICLAGQCGRVIRGSTSDCMGSCGAHQQCSYCLNSYNCGWCAEQGIAGIGKCFEGGIQGQENLFVETLFTIRWCVPEKFNRPFIPLSNNFQLACQVGYFDNEIGFFREFTPRTYQLAISEFPRASVSKRG